MSDSRHWSRYPLYLPRNDHYDPHVDECVSMIQRTPSNKNMSRTTTTRRTEMANRHFALSFVFIFQFERLSTSNSVRVGNGRVGRKQRKDETNLWVSSQEAWKERGWIGTSSWLLVRWLSTLRPVSMIRFYRFKMKKLGGWILGTGDYPPTKIEHVNIETSNHCSPKCT